ncbi:hypothetical protein MMC19_001275 [Ptychographa xylographoides]|nr:hypothetical protein [Ptychographa xylographoides]
MSKRTVFSTVTAIPPGITRECIMSTLYSHVEMIDLNPLVIERHPIKPPGNASAEEYHCTWYEITDKIHYIPGGVASGKVTYTGCFHNLPNGIQTHCYAPLGLNIKGRWTLGGSLPGEPKEPQELGLGVPKDGLWLREDVDMKCNIMMVAFVKKTFRKAHLLLVDRLVEKAHILEAQVQNAAIERGSVYSRSPSSPGYPPTQQYQDEGSVRSISHSDSSKHGSYQSPDPQHQSLYQPPPKYDQGAILPYIEARRERAESPYMGGRASYQAMDPTVRHNSSTGLGIDPAYRLSASSYEHPRNSNSPPMNGSYDPRNNPSEQNPNYNDQKTNPYGPDGHPYHQNNYQYNQSNHQYNQNNNNNQNNPYAVESNPFMHQSSQRSFEAVELPGNEPALSHRALVPKPLSFSARAARSSPQPTELA